MVDNDPFLELKRVLCFTYIKSNSEGISTLSIYIIYICDIQYIRLQFGSHSDVSKC